MADRRSFSETIFDLCRKADVDLVTLAGFLCHLEIPDDFAGRVMNIHPALIPAFCGKGMYGEKVHAAVLERGCKVSGCTVHFADNEYDHGPIILQRAVPVLDDDTPDTLAARVFEQECEAYPEAIRLLGKSPEVSIVLMDIMMPEMDGYETMEVIRRNPAWRRLPIVALTAKAMKGDREKCLEAGATDYLAKPVDTEQLLAVLRMWLHR